MMSSKVGALLGIALMPLFPGIALSQIEFVNCVGGAVPAPGSPISPLGDTATSKGTVSSLVDTAPTMTRVAEALVDKHTGLSLGSLPQPIRPLQQVDTGAAIKQVLEEGAVSFSVSERMRQDAGGQCKAALATLRQIFEAQRVAMHFPSNEEADLAAFPAWYLTANVVDRDAARPVVDAEVKFDRACMQRDIPAEMNPVLVKRAVGVLMFGDKTFCSALRIGQDRVVTARHCFLDQKTGKPTNDSATVQRGFATFWFAYEGEPMRRFEVCRAGLPIGGSGSVETQDDSLTLNIARTAEPVAPMHWTQTTIAAGTSLYLRGYYIFAPESDPLQKLRATAFGGCAATLVGGRCVFHACQTLAAMSGSPIFVRPEPENKNSELTVAGIHLGPASLAPQALCTIEGSIIGKNNLGFLPMERFQ